MLTWSLFKFYFGSLWILKLIDLFLHDCILKYYLSYLVHFWRPVKFCAGGECFTLLTPVSGHRYST